MKLVDLIISSDTDIALPAEDAEIRAVCYDSRKALKGSLFVCMKGAQTDGHKYAAMAYKQGCRCFVCERRPEGLPEDAIVLFSNNTREALAKLAAAFFGHPERRMKLIGITGTKGKTTTALMIKGIMDGCDRPCGYIGSNGVDFAGFHFDTVNTTPEGCDIYEYLSRMLAVGVDTAVLEVSSQALYTGRVTGLAFDACIFTNFSRDHIGEHEHPNMEHYKACKLRLFSEHCRGYALINSDDPVSGEFAEAAKRAGNEVEFFSSCEQTDYSAGEIEYFKNEKGLCSSFYGDFKGKRLKVKQKFPGDFSVMNALSALAVCQRLGVELKMAIRRLDKVSIKGRFEAFRLGDVDYVIDYAHNGKSLRSVLEVLRTYEPGRLICLFGSVGCRTYMRRSELGRVAAELADLSILTADNPDVEPVEFIIAEIAAEYTDPNSYVSIPDRKEAIEYAVKIARPGDIVLLAGKGHEDYQLINGRRLPFSEREILMNAAEALVV